MKKHLLLLLMVFAVVFVFGRWLFSSHNSRESIVMGAEKTPVLVELFTSEGCSSCPDADALLARLDMEQPIGGAEAIVLEEHVDYWDGQGWPDPFSSRSATARQEEYSGFLHSEVYTPQMIVDGRTEFVGSSASTARNAITKAASEPKAAIHLEWSGESANNSRVIHVRVEHLPDGAAPGNAEVFLAMTESHLHSKVLGGENGGRSLEHDGVVRVLTRIGKADGRGDAAFDAQPAVKIAASWRHENLRAVVFVQDSRSRRVLGAAALKF